MFRTRYIPPRAGLVIGAVLMATSGAMAQSGGILVLEGGTLIDGTGKAPVSDPVIVVQGGRIKAVGRKGQLAIPAGAKIIDTAGRTILPGLIDVHAHTQEWQLPMFLPYGVTTILDQSSDEPWILAQREALQKGRIHGPRMFVGGTPMQGPLWHQAMGTFDQADQQTVADARAYALKMVKDGVDVIKVNSNITDDQLAAAIQVGKETHHPVLGHSWNIRKAAALGFKWAEHSWSVGNAIMDPDDKTVSKSGLEDSGGRGPSVTEQMDPKDYPPLVEYLVKHGVFMNLTLTREWMPCSAARSQERVNDAKELLKDPGLGFVPAAAKKQWTEIPACQPGFAHVQEFLRQYAAAGGKANVGSETGFNLHVVPGQATSEEMEMLFDAGYSRMQVIQAVTMWNAEAIGKDKILGSVEPGKIADFAIIEGDPLADLSAMRKVRMVIKDGEVMDTHYDPNWVNPIPQPWSVFEYPVPPQVSGLTPMAAPEGGGSIALEVDGTQYTPKSIVRFDDVDLPTTFVSDKKLTATLDAKLLQRAPGSYLIYVLEPGIHGTTSAPGYFHILAKDAALPADNSFHAAKPVIPGVTGQSPRINGLLPGGARQGDGPVTVQISGSKFAPNSVVHFDDVVVPTKFVSATKLTATLPAAALARPAASYVLYVVNPGPHASDTNVEGTVSEPGYFLVNLKK